MWFILALGSAVFAALTSILAKIGIDGVNSTLATAIRPAFEGYDCGQVGASIYQVLDELSREGKLKCKRRYMPGQLEGLFAPEDYMWL